MKTTNIIVSGFFLLTIEIKRLVPIYITHGEFEGETV